MLFHLSTTVPLHRDFRQVCVSIFTMIHDCVVLGHSFVSGFEHHLRTKHSVCITPSQVACALGVDRSCKRVHLIGTRGAHTSQLLTCPRLRQIQPRLVIIDCGSNEIACGHPPLQVASRIIDCAQHLLTLNYVQRVLVCSLLVRSDKTGCLTLDQFNSNISKCNHYLKVFAASESEVAYHSHQGFWTVPVGVWSRDGLHPNTAAGRKKYQVSLRRAILSFST